MSQFHLSFHHMYNTLYIFYNYWKLNHSVISQKSSGFYYAIVSQILMIYHSSWNNCSLWQAIHSFSVSVEAVGELKASPYPGYIESKIIIVPHNFVHVYLCFSPHGNSLWQCISYVTGMHSINTTYSGILGLTLLQWQQLQESTCYHIHMNSLCFRFEENQMLQFTFLLGRMAVIEIQIICTWYHG